MEMTKEDFVLGLDLGQSNDYSALSVVRRLRPGMEKHYQCVHLHRWPIGTAYTAVVADVAEMMQRPELRGRATLVLDRTGVGAAIFDMFSGANLSPVGISITGGEQSNPVPGGWSVPKKDLVGVLQATLQEERLKIAPELPQAALLVQELQSFEVRITTTGHAQYAADWRSNAHDDLVLSLACALWWAELPDPPEFEPCFYTGFSYRSG